MAKMVYDVEKMLKQDSSNIKFLNNSHVLGSKVHAEFLAANVFLQLVQAAAPFESRLDPQASTESNLFS